MVYLPTGYGSSGPNYPALYLLHGNGGDENGWAVQGHVQASSSSRLWCAHFAYTRVAFLETWPRCRAALSKLAWAASRVSAA